VAELCVRFLKYTHRHFLKNRMPFDVVQNQSPRPVTSRAETGVSATCR
jgi:hypothetical protein